MEELEPNTWQLSPLHQSQLPRSIEVGEEGATLGRASDNSVEIDGELHPEVSAHHARLALDGEELILEDLGSTHGVLVEGERVARRSLQNGEIFELGPGGPRFVVHRTQDLAATSAIPASVVPATRPRRPIGDETVEIVAERLGIEPQEGVEAMIEKRTRHLGILGVVMLLLIGGGLYALFRAIRSTGESFAVRTEELRTTIEERLTADATAMEEQRLAWQRNQRETERASEEWARQRAELSEERGRLQQAIARLEAGDKDAAGQLAALRTQFEETSRSLSMYDPVSLEMHRLEVVESIEDSVVMVEATQYLVDRDTGEELYYELADDGSASFNFAGVGERFAQEATGSGFCVSPEGYIITNAHVVLEGGEEDEENVLPSEFFEQRTVLSVVFSGSGERHTAEVVRWVRNEREDLALVRIEPFEGMPFLSDLDLDRPPPPRGTDVFVLGFPLGKQVLQEGDVVIASTFRGIVSRQVDYYLQIDAAIHPGASGGPVIDGEGRVLGIVTGVQALGMGNSSAIGYIIPIAEARAVWPLPEVGEESEEGEDEEG